MLLHRLAGGLTFHIISIRAISFLEQRRIAHIARAPTGTVSLRETWRGSCNHEENPNHNFFHRFLLSPFAVRLANACFPVFLAGKYLLVCGLVSSFVHT